MRPATAALAVALGAALAALGGCLAGHPRLAAPAGPAFDPAAFFSGATRGAGTLAVRGRRAQAVRVESRGAWGPDSAFHLDQTVWLGDGPPRRRSWTMRPDGAGAYAATLTDARGPVRLTAEGPVLRIRYRMGPATTMHQTLTLGPDGRSARNVATVRVLGVPWARLDEAIVRASP